MQAYDELSLVVELFHQCKLFFQIHGSGAADCCARFGAKCQFTGHEAACIEDEVCLFQHRPSSHGDKVRVAGTCTYNLDVPPALGADVQGGGYRIVLAFAFRHYQLAISGGQQCGCLAYTGRTHVLHHCFAGVGHVHCRQFLGRIEEDFVFLLERFHYRFVTLDVNRRYGYDGLRGDVVLFQLFYNAFHNFSRGACLPGKSDADVHHARHIADGRYVLYIMYSRRDDQYQLEAG